MNIDPMNINEQAACVERVREAERRTEPLNVDIAAWLFANCKIVYFDADYPIEHNLKANKDGEAFLRAEASEALPPEPEPCETPTPTAETPRTDDWQFDVSYIAGNGAPATQKVVAASRCRTLERELTAIRQQHAEEVARLKANLDTIEWSEERKPSWAEIGALNDDRTAALAAQSAAMQQLADIHTLATSPALFSEARLAAIAERARPHHTPV